MSEEIEWGPEIEVGRKWPTWLSGFPGKIMYKNHWGGWHTTSDEVSEEWHWEYIPSIRLPANHPHYATTEQPEDTWKPDERTVRACIEALPRASLLYHPDEFNTLNRAALEALLPKDPAVSLVEEWMEEVVYDADKRLLTEFADWLIEQGKLK